MEVTGIVRRVWNKWALVDIGADRLARLHVREHPRQVTRYGFYRLGALHKYAYTAYARGAQLKLWVHRLMSKGSNATSNPAVSEFIQLTCCKPRSPDRETEPESRRPGPGVETVPHREE